jgi:hypothetical protein
MRFSSVLLVVLSAALVVAFPACTKAGGSSASAYGTKVKFAKGLVLHFPDFDLAYTGSRHVATPKYAHGFDYDDFTISHGGVSKTVSWSSGTGLIDWTDFEVGGKNFALELRGSRKFGWLKENELVVSRQ